MYKNLTVQSYKGSYSIVLEEKPFSHLKDLAPESIHYIVDKRVAELYKQDLEPIFAKHSPLLLEANEQTKSLECIPDMISHLTKNGLRKNHTLVAIGGGVIQDITCFIATTVLRGVDWIFWPTTLLAQGDSCIGSKSSINCAGTKNIVGSFYPPKQIYMCTKVLNTLTKLDFYSGVGEMIKIHIIDGPETFSDFEKDFDRILSGELLDTYIMKALAIKKKIIEVDEFDVGIRRVLNYGHSFGHAIESATDYGVPHGIAVSMGMHLANYISVYLNFTSETEHYFKMSALLKKNFAPCKGVKIPYERFESALRKDKKNSNDKLGLVLLDARGIPAIEFVAADTRFKDVCLKGLQEFSQVY